MKNSDDNKTSNMVLTPSVEVPTQWISIQNRHLPLVYKKPFSSRCSFTLLEHFFFCGLFSNDDDDDDNNNNNNTYISDI